MHHQGPAKTAPVAAGAAGSWGGGGEQLGSWGGGGGDNGVAWHAKPMSPAPVYGKVKRALSPASQAKLGWILAEQKKLQRKESAAEAHKRIGGGKVPLA